MRKGSDLFPVPIKRKQPVTDLHIHANATLPTASGSAAQAGTSRQAATSSAGAGPPLSFSSAVRAGVQLGIHGGSLGLQRDNCISTAVSRQDADAGATTKQTSQRTSRLQSQSGRAPDTTAARESREARLLRDGTTPPASCTTRPTGSPSAGKKSLSSGAKEHEGSVALANQQKNALPKALTQIAADENSKKKPENAVAGAAEQERARALLTGKGGSGNPALVSAASTSPSAGGVDEQKRPGPSAGGRDSGRVAVQDVEQTSGRTEQSKAATSEAAAGDPTSSKASRAEKAKKLLQSHRNFLKYMQTGLANCSTKNAAVDETTHPFPERKIHYCIQFGNNSALIRQLLRQIKCFAPTLGDPQNRFSHVRYEEKIATVTPKEVCQLHDVNLTPCDFLWTQYKCRKFFDVMRGQADEFAFVSKNTEDACEISMLPPGRARKLVAALAQKQNRTKSPTRGTAQVPAGTSSISIGFGRGIGATKPPAKAVATTPLANKTRDVIQEHARTLSTQLSPSNTGMVGPGSTPIMPETTPPKTARGPTEDGATPVACSSPTSKGTPARLKLDVPVRQEDSSLVVSFSSGAEDVESTSAGENSSSAASSIPQGVTPAGATPSSVLGTASEGPLEERTILPSHSSTVDTSSSGGCDNVPTATTETPSSRTSSSSASSTARSGKPTSRRGQANGTTTSRNKSAILSSSPSPMAFRDLPKGGGTSTTPLRHESRFVDVRKRPCAYHNHLEGNQVLCTKIGLFECLRRHLGIPGVYQILPFAYVVRNEEDIENFADIYNMSLSAKKAAFLPADAYSRRGTEDNISASGRGLEDQDADDCGRETKEDSTSSSSCAGSDAGAASVQLANNRQEEEAPLETSALKDDQWNKRDGASSKGSLPATEVDASRKSSVSLHTTSADANTKTKNSGTKNAPGMDGLSTTPLDEAEARESGSESTATKMDDEQQENVRGGTIEDAGDEQSNTATAATDTGSSESIDETRHQVNPEDGSERTRQTQEPLSGGVTRVVEKAKTQDTIDPSTTSAEAGGAAVCKNNLQTAKTRATSKSKKAKASGVRGNVWLLKPGLFANRGTGIEILTELEKIQAHLRKKIHKYPFLLQKYIERPFLVEGRKFDIRAYALVLDECDEADDEQPSGVESSYGTAIGSGVAAQEMKQPPDAGASSRKNDDDPDRIASEQNRSKSPKSVGDALEAYYYVDYYIRTTSTTYSCSDFANRLKHLNNDAVQKHGSDYGKFESANKLSIPEFQAYLEKNRYSNKGFSTTVLTEQIKAHMRTVFTASASLLNPRRIPGCYEMFGFDFMLDTDFRCWLIEVNTNPCLELCNAHLATILPPLIESTIRKKVFKNFGKWDHKWERLDLGG
ncbi:unnamed protein product [Amoebophrya sp. A120]|nr:unnamed protein product [Amoebophrya sp. A120]|eukprot:GSA120T00017494001.1